MFERAFERLRVQPVEIAIRNLPRAFSGFRILQLTDLHIGRHTPATAIQRLVDRVNDQAPDLIALTGDVIDAKAEQIEAQLCLLGKLEAPTYFVSGNHDLFKGLAPLRERLTALGVVDLDNRCLRLEREGREINLLGISDRMSRFFSIERNLEAVFTQIDDALPSILLAHQPKDIRHAHLHGIDFQISGHTHGGQIYPFHHFIRLDQPFLHGHHRVRETQIYVSRGVGTWGIPLRFRAESEIPVFRLCEAPAPAAGIHGGRAAAERGAA